MAVPSKTEPPEFLLDAIREGAEFTLYRAESTATHRPSESKRYSAGMGRRGKLRL